MGGWEMKIATEKNETDVFDFFGAIFVTHRASCDDCDGAGEYVGGHRAEKINRCFRFFEPRFSLSSFIPIAIP